MYAQGFIFLIIGGHILPDMSGSLIYFRQLPTNVLLTFYIVNPSRHDTRTHRYQPARIDRWIGPIPEHGARELKRGRRGGGPGKWRQADPRSYVPHDSFDSLGGDALTFTLGLTPDAPSHPSRAGTSYVTLRHSSVPHMPISGVSSSDSEEQGDEPADDVIPAQQLSFGRRVRNKTTRFTPSDYR
ncbi:hypothetical protein M9H77_31619 [Catharanthus roseus]|uniref:Uncharacterized protein n=1 Tax=Catharanthus roseus TaxID=4058 RepID=A0ACC0A0L8_CATRO|nr:hypothetical protein M9H77_31619 [Catharanthus roseus]